MMLRTDPRHQPEPERDPLAIARANMKASRKITFNNPTKRPNTVTLPPKAKDPIVFKDNDLVIHDECHGCVMRVTRCDHVKGYTNEWYYELETELIIFGGQPHSVSGATHDRLKRADLIVLGSARLSIDNLMRSVVAGSSSQGELSE